MGRNETQNVQTPFHKIDWTKNDSVVSFVESAWSNRPAEQKRAEMLGELCAAWYDGNQYLFHTSIGGTQLAPLPNPLDRLRLVFNLFAPHLDQYVAKIAMDPLEPEALPRTGSIPDLDAARLQTSVCQYYRDLLDLQYIKDDMVTRIAMGAMSFTKVAWDPLAGNEFGVGVDDARAFGVDEPVLSDLFQEDEQGSGYTQLNMGEVAVQNVSLANLTWGPVGVPFEEAEWVLEVRDRSITYVKNRWGLKDEEIQPAYANTLNRWYHGAFDQFGSIKEPVQDDRVLVYELYCPRGPDSPKGRHAIVIGNKVVNRKRNRDLANPYDHGQVPYIACMALAIPGKPIGKTPAWDMFEPQAMLNKLASQIMENVELFANPRMWAQEDEPIDEWELSSRPGGVHRFRHRMPEMMQGVTLPASVYAIFDRWIRVLQECIGVHDVSIGKAPQSGRSGRFVLALQDADNTRLTRTMKRVKRWGEDLFRMLLAIVRQYANDYRLIAIRGADNRWERRAFRGEELVPGATAGGPEVFNIQLRTTGQARSRAAQIELVTMLIQYGFFRPEDPEDRRQVMLMLELGDTTHKLDDEQAHRDMQRRVHESLMRGRYIPPQYYHRHQIRLDELRRFQNTPEFEAQAPEIQQLFKRYEIQTLRLQAVRELEVKQIVQGAVAEFQRRLSGEQAPQALDQLPGGAAPRGPNGVGQMRAGPQGNRLREFLQAAGPAPAMS